MSNLQVQVVEWKGPSKNSTYSTVSLNSSHASVPSGECSPIGMSWNPANGAMTLPFDPQVDRAEHFLELSVMEGNMMGDMCVAKSITKLSGYPTLLVGGEEIYQPVLSSGSVQVGTLIVKMSIRNDAPQAQPPQAQPPVLGSSAPPMAPSAPSAPPAPTAPQGSAPSAPPPSGMWPTQIPSNPYAESLPSAPPGPSAPAWSGAPGQPQNYVRCEILPNQQGPLKFTGNPPMPGPPTSKQTPTELWNEHVAKTELNRQQRDAQWKQTQTDASTKPKGGLFSQLTKGLSDAAHHTGAFLSDACNSAETSVRDHDLASLRKHWAGIFTNLARTEVVESGYKCKYVNGKQQPIDGMVYVSTRYISFIPAVPTAEQPPFFEEFRNIVTVVRSRALGMPCLQLYSRAGFVFQFSNFATDLKRQVGSVLGTVKYSPFESFEIYVDRHWRQCAQIPVPGYQYMPR